MSKTIKLDDKIYDKLTGLMGPKETYSQVVERLLVFVDRQLEVLNALEGAAMFRQGQKERLEQQKQGEG